MILYRRLTKGIFNIFESERSRDLYFEKVLVTVIHYKITRKYETDNLALIIMKIKRNIYNKIIHINKTIVG